MLIVIHLDNSRDSTEMIHAQKVYISGSYPFLQPVSLK